MALYVKHKDSCGFSQFISNNNSHFDSVFCKTECYILSKKQVNFHETKIMHALLML